MSAPEHEHSARIDLAAQWLVETLPEHQPRPLVPSLRTMFGLTAMVSPVSTHGTDLRL